MSWTNEGSYWSRPLDCHDRLFQAVSAAGAPLGREHWLFCHWLGLTFPSTTDAATKEQRLRDGWGALRLKHPDVAVTLHEDEKRYVPLSDDAALREYTSATFHVETEAQSINELFPRLKVAPAPAEYAACYWVPASSEIGIVSPHWRWDGRGLMMMMSELMDLVAGTGADPDSGTPASSSLSLLPAPGAETVNLVPSIDSVLGVSHDEVHEEKWLKKADELIAPFTDGSPAIGLPITPAMPQDTTRACIVLPKDVTAAVLSACRSRDLRLTSALHASIIQVTQRNQAEGQDNKGGLYKSWAAFDLRKQCPPPANGPAHAPSIRIVAMPIIVDPTKPWSNIASGLQTLYGQSMDPTSDNLKVRVPYVEKATSYLATAPPSTEPNLSNLGVLENLVKKKYGDIEINDVGTVVQMISPQLYMHSWSWDGETRFSVCYNEAFYEKPFVQGWLDELKANLLENLGVKV